ncbi:MAG: lytic transglycosylase domain-containing protein [Paracoccaceae bacterium]
MSAARALRTALAALLLALPALPAGAGWSGFYTSSPKTAAEPRAQARAPSGPVPAQSVCLREILRAQLRHGIPDNILLGIGLQEAGVTRGGTLTVWPWAVNAAGDGRIFDSRAAALDWVRERQAAGVDSIDVGCMQINLRWHPAAFEGPAQGFDPAVNVDYAARFLRRLYDKTGDWKTAAGAYHSFTPEKQEIYLATLTRNVAVANDRIAHFRAVAADVPGPEVTRPPQAPARESAQPGGSIWSAGLSAGADGKAGRRSIYSEAELQPVLPNFRQAF